MRLFFIFMSAIALTLSSCLFSADTKNPPKPRTNPTYSSPVNPELNNIPTNNLPVEVPTDGVNTNDKVVISFTKKVGLERKQVFKYSNNPNAIKNSIVVLEFIPSGSAGDGISLELKENEFIWKSVYTVNNEWEAEMTLNGTIYSNNLSFTGDSNNGPFKAKMLIKGDSLVWFTLNDRKYTKSPEKAASTAKLNDHLQYYDNHEVKPQRNDNLKSIIQKYNEQNNTNFTLEEVIEKNPFLKSRKDNTIYTSDVIKF